MSNFVVIGCGGHARSVANTLLSNTPNIDIIFVDRNARPNENILSFPVETNMPDAFEAVHIAIGDNSYRKELVRQYADKLMSVISNGATIGSSATIEDGVFIAHGSYIGPLSKIGRGTIINTGALIEHETKIGDFCHVAPNATVCGRSAVGNNVVLGASCTVINEISICDDVVIGANSTVLSNIKISGTYVGNPVRKVE